MELKFGMEKADLRFAVLSDVHITHRGQGIEKFTEAVMQLVRMEPKPDAFVFSGDIAYQIDKAGGGVADQLYEEPYDMINAVLRRYVSPLPVIYANGNHEFGQGRHEPDITEAAVAMFREKTGKELHEHHVVGGYHFISMGIEDGHWHYTENAESYAMAECKKALAENPELPVFLVFHIPVHQTVVDTEAKAHSEAFTQFLMENPRIVAIVGHLHTPVNDPRTIWQKAGGFTTVHAPLGAVGNLCIPKCENRTQGGAPYSQGLYFEVKGTKVLIHKLNFTTGKEVDEPWELDTAQLLKGEGYYYTDRRKEISNTPAFPQKTQVIWEFMGDGRLAVEFVKADCKAAGRNQDGFTQYYRFDFSAPGSNALCKSMVYASDFFANQPGERFAAVLPTGLPRGKYVLTVTPISPFGKEGEPVVLKVKLK